MPGSKIKKEKAPSALFKRDKTSSSIDLKKINRLRKAIRERRYEIDFEKLAEKLLKVL